MTIKAWLISLLLIGGIPGFFFMGPFGVTVPLIVPDVLQRSDRWVGFLWGAVAARLHPDDV